MPVLSPLLLVDGHNLLHRAAFGFPARITSRHGRDITCAFGFFALLRAAARSAPQPPHLVVVFDGENGAEVRRRLDPGYKPPVAGDQEVFADLPRIRDGLDMLGVTWIEHPRWEADDVIATLVERGDRRTCLIMSTDKDFYQLLGPRTMLLNTSRRADRRLVTVADVVTQHGVTPDQWCDYRALTGDPSDNIPGIRGVGPKTASRLLAEGARLDDLDALGRLTGRTGMAIQNQWESLRLWRSLIALTRTVSLDQTPPSEKPTDLPLAADVIRRLGLWESTPPQPDHVTASLLAPVERGRQRPVGERTR